MNMFRRRYVDKTNPCVFMTNDRSPMLFFFVARPSKPDLYQYNETLVESALALFVCSSHGGNPSPMFTWSINQMPINE